MATVTITEANTAAGSQSHGVTEECSHEIAPQDFG
jgi:hypothetical protein